MILEVRHFQLIEAISATGTVTAAAKRVFLTQPAVSHALRDLEGRLGVQLFRRERTRMVPTAVCQRLLHAGEAILHEVAHAEHDLRQFRIGRRGTVRIATECYTSYHWLPDVVRELHVAFPQVDVQVVADAAADPCRHVRRGAVDVAMIQTRAEGDEVTLHELLPEAEVVAVVSADHPLARKRFVRPRDLAGQHLILHGEGERRVTLDRFLRPEGIEFGQTTVVPFTDAVMQLVGSGVGITLVPRWVAAPSLTRDRIVALRLGSQGVFRSWFAAVSGRSQRLPFVEAAVSLMRARLGQHATGAPESRRAIQRGA